MVSSAGAGNKKTLKVGIASEVEGTSGKSLDRATSLTDHEEGVGSDEEGGGGEEEVQQQIEAQHYSPLEVADPAKMVKIIDLVKKGTSQMESVL